MKLVAGYRPAGGVWHEQSLQSLLEETTGWLQHFLQYHPAPFSEWSPTVYSLLSGECNFHFRTHNILDTLFSEVLCRGQPDGFSVDIHCDRVIVELENLMEEIQLPGGIWTVLQERRKVLGVFTQDLLFVHPFRKRFEFVIAYYNGFLGFNLRAKSQCIGNPYLHVTGTVETLFCFELDTTIRDAYNRLRIELVTLIVSEFLESQKGLHLQLGILPE